MTNVIDKHLHRLLSDDGIKHSFGAEASLPQTQVTPTIPHFQHNMGVLDLYICNLCPNLGTSNIFLLFFFTSIQAIQGLRSPHDRVPVNEVVIKKAKAGNEH